MPTRSLRSASMRWPGSREVDAGFRAWARRVLATRPEVLRVGYFGSYARGDHGVGSDLDVVLVVRPSPDPFPSRVPGVDDAGLPVPADILVFTEAELDAMRRQGRRLAREIDSTAVWYDPDLPPSSAASPGPRDRRGGR